MSKYRPHRIYKCRKVKLESKLLKILNQLKYRYIDKQQQKIEKYGFIYDKINKQVIYLTKQ